MKRTAALVGVMAISAVAQAQSMIHLPDFRTGNEPLLEPVPYPYGRSRVVTKDAPATPHFLVQGTGAIYTRTPHDRVWGRDPGPAWYGAPKRIYALSFAKVGEMPVGFDPFDRLVGETLPADLRTAQRQWLLQHQLVGAARIVKKAGDHHASEHKDLHAGLPEPRAILKIEKRPAEELKSTENLPLQARLIGIDHIEIVSANLADEAGAVGGSELAQMH